MIPANQVVKVTPPVALLSCEDAPAVSSAPRSKKQVADYIAQLYAAGDDCRTKLQQVKLWSE